MAVNDTVIPRSLTNQVDNTTLEVSSGKVQVKDGGINSNKIANGSIETEDIKDGAVTDNKLNAPVVEILACGIFSGTTAGDKDQVNISGLNSSDIIRVYWNGYDNTSSTFKVQIKISDGTHTYTYNPSAVHNVYQLGEIKIINIINHTSDLFFIGTRDDNNGGAIPNSIWEHHDGAMNTDYFTGDWSITLSCTGGAGARRNLSWIVERIKAV